MDPDDEAYLISEMLNSLGDDPVTAKCWKIFSKSMYPRSFAVQYQCYKMESEDKNLIECVLCLSDMVKDFPKEPLLISELKNMAIALSSESDNFLTKVFELLPDEIKYGVMLAVTGSVQTVEEHCELMLLFLKRLPSTRFHQHGSNIIETLLTAEQHAGTFTPINLFRKMLVCDALSLTLGLSQVDYKFKMLFHLLQRAVEFYVCCIFTPPTDHDAAIRNEVIPQSDNNPDECWKPLLQLFETVAHRYKWNFPEMFYTNYSELSLRKLLSQLKKKNKTIANLICEKNRREDMSGFDEAYFTLVITFFYYLYQYGSIVFPKVPSKTATGPYNFFLVEGICDRKETHPHSLGPEFKKTNNGHIVIGKCVSTDVSSILIPSFLTAVECFDMIQRHSHLAKEFQFLAKNIQMELWPVYQEFYIDMLIYMKHYDTAMNYLRNGQATASDICVRNKAALQMASCYYSLMFYSNCLKILFDIIIILPTSSTSSSSSTINIGKCTSRYTYFIGYDNKDVVQYCITLLLILYKSVSKVPDAFKSMYLGYLLVLIQFNMEHEYELLSKIMDSIKQLKIFSFTKFFNYIIHVDILEEMSCLASAEDENVELDILPTSTILANKQRAVTRGVNKSARDDMRQAFVNQMDRCYDDINSLFIEFIREEHGFLLLPLSELHL